MLKKLAIFVFCLMYLTGCSNNRIKSSVDNFDIHTLVTENLKYEDELPILVLLENESKTIITVASQDMDMKKDMYYELSNDIGYHVIKKDHLLYIQNSENCYVINVDGTINKTERINDFVLIEPIESDVLRDSYCFNRDCAIEEDSVKYKTDPEVIIPGENFDYKDYHMVSFTRLCDYLID